MNDFENIVESELEAHQAALDAGTIPDSTNAPEETDLPVEIINRIKQNKECLNFLEQIRQALEGDIVPAKAHVDANGMPQRIGRFQIKEQLGIGGFGIVFRGFDETVGREVAIKIPRAELLASPRLLERFRTEARALARLDHPNIVPVLGSDEEGITPYIVMPFLPGGHLADRMQSRSTHPPKAAADIVRQLAEGVGHAHNKGILHRDIKPTNVLLAENEYQGKNSYLPFIPKITDFGLAKLEDSDQGQTQTGAFLGTTAYMAPEQAEGRNHDISALSDVFSLGVILYELLTGTHPFRAGSPLKSLENISKHDPPPIKSSTYGIPIDLEAICLKCLEKQPENRYQSAHDLSADLQRFLTGSPVEARPLSSWRRFYRWCLRHPLTATVGLLASLSLTALVIVSLVYNTRLAALLKIAETERATVRKQATTIRQTACWSDTRLAQIAWNQGDANQAISLLERHIPGPGDQDVRHFAWWQLWREYKQGGIILGTHKGGANAVSVTKDGLLAASAGEDTVIRLWDLPNRKQITGLKGHEFGGVNTVEFSPEGAELASGGDDGVVRIWKMGSYLEVFALKGHQGEVLDVAYSPSAELIASAGEDAVVRLWDARTKELTAKLKGHTKEITTIAFHPTEPLLVSTSKDGTLRFWDLERHEPDQRVPNGLIQVPKEENWCRTVTFAPDGKSLVAGSIMSDLFHWEWKPNEYGKVIDSYEQKPNARSLTWSSTGSLYVGETLGGINNFDHANNNFGERHSWKQSIPKGSNKGVNGLAIPETSKVIVSASEDETVQLWVNKRFPALLNQRSSIPHAHSEKEKISQIDWAPQTIVTRTELCKQNGFSIERVPVPGHLDIFSSSDGSLCRTLPIAKEEEYAVSPQGNYLLLCHRNGKMRCLKSDNGNLLWQLDIGKLEATDSQRSQLSISQDESHALICWGKELILISMKTGEISHAMKHAAFVTGALFTQNPEPPFIGLSISVDGSLYFWNLDEGILERVHEHPYQPLRCCTSLALNRTNSLVAIGRLNGRAEVYQFPQMKLIATFSHPDNVMQVGFFEHDEILLTRSVTTNFWNIKEQTKLLSYTKQHLLTGDLNEDDFWRKVSGPFVLSPDGKDLAIPLFDRIKVVQGLR